MSIKETNRAEIERRRQFIEGLFTEGDNSFYDGQDDAYNHILAFLDSLPEQPVYGLEEEIAIWIPNHIKCEKDPDLRRAIIKWAGFVARHFYELGQQNKQPASEGLGEEIARYLREECSADDEPSISEIARHFAEWGAEHLKK